MFELPRYVIKSGVIVVEEGEIRTDYRGTTLHVAPDYDSGVESQIHEWFEQYYSIRYRNYPVADDYLHNAQRIDCKPAE